MLAVRVIPCLLLQGRGLVKTIKFKSPKYIGDPVNCIRIFNEKEVDELIVLDITATPEQKKPNFGMIEEIASECFMPLCYGGGIRTIEDIKTIFSLGAEKIAINSYGIENPEFLRKAVERFGGQSIVASIDVKKKYFGGYEVVTNSARKKTSIDPAKMALSVQDMGVGEIVINSVDLDGTQAGYNTGLIKRITEMLKIPVIALGGAGCIQDFAKVVDEGGASAVAAGSMFVFHGKHNAVLINYPKISVLEKILPHRQRRIS